MAEAPDPVRAVMTALAEGLAEILGARLLGVYLGGSACLGDFSEATSDIDFLVVTDGPLTDADARQLGELHAWLWRAVPYGDRLEGEYAPRDQLVPEGTLAPVPEVKQGVFRRETTEIMLSADNVFNVREQGIAFFGPEPRALLPAVTPELVRAAVCAMLADGPGPARTPAQAASEVLDLMRSLCALEAGRPVTKSDGVTWALAHFPQRWHAAVRSARSIRDGAAERMDQPRVMAALPRLYRSARRFASRYSASSRTED